MTLCGRLKKTEKRSALDRPPGRVGGGGGDLPHDLDQHPADGGDEVEAAAEH